MQEIPFTPSNPFDEFDTQLGSETCRLVQRWNPEDSDGRGAWYLDVLTLEDQPIAHGIKIVLGVPLGRRVQHAIFQNGAIVAIDTSKQGRDATLDDLGTRVRVFYLPTFEIISTLAQQG
jgi:hypothetical protein